MVGDSCQLLGIFVRFRTALEDPGHGVFRSRGLVRDLKIIAKRYLKSTFIIDFVASLPLPQFIGAGYYSIYIHKLLECRGVVLEEKRSAAISGWDELLKECAMDDQIEQGMLSDLYKNKVGSRSFLQRYMYCFSRGLKCLSSMGQNLETSASVLETSFSFSMTIFGLVLFAGMIAQMQYSIYG